MDRDKLRQELIRDEGLRLTPYRDTVGLWTIGVGHLLGDTPRMSRITSVEADALLESDISAAVAMARMLVPSLPRWMYDGLTPSSNDSRCRALVNMAFNLGSRLQRFRYFLAAVNREDWKAAAEAMMLSKWATQVGPRAVRLRDMILTED